MCTEHIYKQNISLIFHHHKQHYFRWKPANKHTHLFHTWKWIRGQGARGSVDPILLTILLADPKVLADPKAFTYRNDVKSFTESVKGEMHDVAKKVIKSVTYQVHLNICKAFIHFICGLHERSLSSTWFHLLQRDERITHMPTITIWRE